MASRTPSSGVPVGRIAFASFIGTVIEFFDFFIFSTAAALVFNKIFFPSLDPLAGTLAAFATFAVAFVAKPLGGVIFGHFGDRLGRKAMLVLSLVMMGTGTAMVGLLPTYAQIGIWAPLLLVVSRVLQGVAIGGEWSGAVLMAVEHAPPGRRAFYSSWPQRGVPAGLVLATVSFYLVGLLPQSAMMSWGWRIPFLASAVLVILGLYIRLKVTESPAFQSVLDRGEVSRFPAGEVVRRAGKPLLIAIFSMAVNSVVFYLSAVYALSYGVQRAGATRGTMLLAVCIAGLVQVFTIPRVAVLADRYGRRPVLLAGAVLAMVTAFPFFWLLNTGNAIAIIVALVIALPVVHTLTYGPMASFLPELFDTRLRYSGSAIGYQVGSMVWSGPVPFVAAALVSLAGNAWPLAVYIIVGGIATVIAVLVARESYRDDIRQVGRPAEENEPRAETATS
ncbi:MFS transporter [Amycolatopsis alkalitolerans]|uniref:Putative proline/betaine transporter n=1 Tax=Amycolatopsis alkalitolerans TaxID=2547244 RepID=A0A5C4M8N8_9PSEU|nr:MFS transporter [Amycolatopsis alkalitolerans]TNC29466.1 MHS family MFS transporter [Amycolatopsis alkalitolerans]